MSVLIGIDPHRRSHAAVAVNGDEQVVGELGVRASRRQIQELLGWAGRYPQRSWAIESAAGLGYLLAQQLVAAGEHVVDVPATLAARVRVLGSTKSQKNDPNDARSVAIAALRQPGLRVVEAEDHVAVLRMLAKRHDGGHAILPLGGHSKSPRAVTGIPRGRPLGFPGVWESSGSWVGGPSSTVIDG